MKKLVILFIFFAGFTASSFGQGATQPTTATATIIAPIALAKLTDMNFGNIGATATAGDIILSPASARTSSGALGATPASGGTVSAATFNVTGSASASFSITLPTSVTLVNGVNNMTCDTFTSTPSGTGTISGVTTLNVGATLHVAANQVPAVYLSPSFPVTVNYN